MRKLGVVFTEMADLDARADDCANDGEYQAFVCASPLKMFGFDRVIDQPCRHQKWTNP